MGRGHVCGSTCVTRTIRCRGRRQTKNKWPQSQGQPGWKRPPPTAIAESSQQKHKTSEFGPSTPSFSRSSWCCRRHAATAKECRLVTHGTCFFLVLVQGITPPTQPTTSRSRLAPKYGQEMAATYDTYDAAHLSTAAERHTPQNQTLSCTTRKRRENNLPDHVDVIGQLRQLAESEGRRPLPELLVVDREDGQVALLPHREASRLKLSIAAPSSHLKGRSDNASAKQEAGLRERRGYYSVY